MIHKKNSNHRTNQRKKTLSIFPVRISDSFSFFFFKFHIDVIIDYSVSNEYFIFKFHIYSIILDDESEIKKKFLSFLLLLLLYRMMLMIN